MSSTPYTKGTEGIDGATDEEIERIWDEEDNLVVSIGGKSGRVSRLHLEEDDGRLCAKRESLNTGDPNFQVKSIECYPPRWKPLCKYCLSIWRMDG